MNLNTEVQRKLLLCLIEFFGFLLVCWIFPIMLTLVLLQEMLFVSGGFIT